MARSHAASPVPGGSATLATEPSALGPPISCGHPVPGNRARPVSWTEIVMTRGSSQNDPLDPVAVVDVDVDVGHPLGTVVEQPLDADGDVVVDAEPCRMVRAAWCSPPQ